MNGSTGIGVVFLLAALIVTVHHPAHAEFVSSSVRTGGRMTASAPICNCPKCRRARTTNAARAYPLPRGRTYYGGRYYGNLNNRFYGPQYGYF